MQQRPIGHSPFFDRGIESVTSGAGNESPRLPDRTQLAPPEAGGSRQLDELLAARSLESLLQASIVPRVADPGLLLPASFAASFDGLVATLNQHLAKATPGSPEARTLQAASRQLLEIKDLCQQARLSRGALVAG